MRELSLAIEAGVVEHPFGPVRGKAWLAIVTGADKRGRLARSFLPRSDGRYDVASVAAFDVLEFGADFVVRGRTIKRREYWCCVDDPGDDALALATGDPTTYAAACALADALNAEADEDPNWEHRLTGADLGI